MAMPWEKQINCVRRCIGPKASLAGGFLLTAVLVAGCGPIKTNVVMNEAEVELKAAKTANAEHLAPYDYTAAEAYLEKAREEHGYSDYSVAIDFAEKALSHAQSAKAKAMEAKSDGAIPVIESAAQPVSAEVEDDEPKLP